MVFTSLPFLFLFLPLFLFSHLLLPARYRNLHSILAGLFFYFVGGGGVTLVFGMLIVLNYWLGARIFHAAGRTRTLWLSLGLVANLGALFYFKYATFFGGMLKEAAAWLGHPLPMAVPEILLPIGISFYVFQFIAYLMDVFRQVHRPSRSFVEFATLITAFPHLVAGPVVRYSDIEGYLSTRPITLDGFHAGFLRFAFGLFRKLAIADTLGALATECFALPSAELTPGLAWLGAVAYAMQIYCDFAGYSDMAIGMALMMGFPFPENFAQPYRSTSVTGFWRRWHMTLSTWFRDYLYIPLGGSRAGPVRTYRNLLIVFLLCGLWHGAAYTFVVWGLFHGALLVIERVLDRHLDFRPHGAAGWLVTFTLVTIGWVFFRAENMPHAWRYLAAMFRLPADGPTLFPLAHYLTADRVAALAAAALISWVPPESVRAAWERLHPSGRVALGGAGALGMLVYSTMVLTANGYNPFIYFRF